MVGYLCPLKVGSFGYLYGGDLPAGAARSGESSRRPLVSWRADFLLQTLVGDLIRT